MSGETASNGMQAFVDQAQIIFTFVMTNLATVVQTVTGNPLMMIGFLITLCGLVVGMFKRLVNIR